MKIFWDTWPPLKSRVHLYINTSNLPYVQGMSSSTIFIRLFWPATTTSRTSPTKKWRNRVPEQNLSLILHPTIPIWWVSCFLLLVFFWKCILIDYMCFGDLDVKHRWSGNYFNHLCYFDRSGGFSLVTRVRVRNVLFSTGQSMLVKTEWPSPACQQVEWTNSGVEWSSVLYLIILLLTLGFSFLL